MKKVLLIGLVLGIFGCQTTPVDFEETDCEDETTTSTVEEPECPPCGEALFGPVFKSDLCYDSNHKFEILQASVCQGKEVNTEACADSICIGQQISYKCWNHIMDNEYLNGNGTTELILNSHVAVNNLLSCEFDNGGK